MLEVHELLRRPAGRLLVRYVEQRHGRALGHFLDRRAVRRLRFEAGLCGRLGTDTGTFAQAVGQAVGAGDGAGDELALQGFAGHETDDVVAPYRTAAGMAGQMHHRAPPARTRQDVAFQHPTLVGDAFAGRIDPGDQRPFDPPHAAGFDHRARRHYGDTAAARLVLTGPVGVRAGVDDGDHLAPRILPVEGGAIGVVVGVSSAPGAGRERPHSD